VIDDTELKDIQSIAAPVQEQVAAGQYQAAVYTWGKTLMRVKKYSNGIDFYNFLVFNAQHVSSDKRTLLANGEYFAAKLIGLRLAIRQCDAALHGLRISRLFN